MVVIYILNFYFFITLLLDFFIAFFLFKEYKDIGVSINIMLACCLIIYNIFKYIKEAITIYIKSCNKQYNKI